jgi:hypothetical protein
MVCIGLRASCTDARILVSTPQITEDQNNNLSFFKIGSFPPLHEVKAIKNSNQSRRLFPIRAL